MIDDPVVQILREAAARGRELRLARERAAQNEVHPRGEASQTPASEQTIGNATTPLHCDDTVEKESAT